MINPKNQNVVKLHIVNMIERDLWHQRFCHISNKNIEKLKQKDFVSGLDYQKVNSDLCHSCYVGKSTKAPCKRVCEHQSNGVLEVSN